MKASAIASKMFESPSHVGIENDTENDLSTVHEAFQFIYKKYVEDSSRNVNFLDMEKIRRNNEKRKKERSKSQNGEEEEEIDQKSKERRSR